MSLKMISGTKNLLRDYGYLSAAVGLNAPLVTCILLRNTDQMQFDALSWMYFISVSVGYYVLAIFVATSLAYFLLFPLRKLAMAVAGTIVIIAVYFLLIDSFVLDVAGMHLDLFWLEWVFNDLDAFGLSTTTVNAALLAMLILVITEVAIFMLARRVKRSRYVVGISWGLLILLFAAGQVAHAVAYEKNDMRITSLTPQLPFYLPVTSHRNASRYGDMLPIGEDRAPRESDVEMATLNYPRHEIKYAPSNSGAKPNIVVMFFESWRYDMLNDSVTPQVNALSQKSTVCLNHFCSGNSTVAGIFGFFYGLHPTYWQAVKAENVTLHNPVLIDLLVESGYEFGIYANSNFERHKIKDAIFRDIEVHEDFAGETSVEQDADITRQLVSFLHEQKRTGEPFMAFGFYKSNHAPYRYPATDTVFRPAGDQRLVGVAKDTDPTLYLNDYRNATRYVDGLVGKVLHELDTLGFMDNTIIIVSTDHGEEFNDNRDGYWGHGSNYSQYQTRIPLVLYAPGKSPRQIERVTAHVDIVPTLLEEFLGCINPPEDYSNGRNLFSDYTKVRPLVIGSYVNHAFVVGDDVFEVSSFYVKDYKLANTKIKASPLPPEVLRRLAGEVNGFFGRNELPGSEQP